MLLRHMQTSICTHANSQLSYDALTIILFAKQAYGLNVNWVSQCWTLWLQQPSNYPHHLQQQAWCGMSHLGGIPDGGQTVSYDQHSAVDHGTVHSLLHQVLTLSIQSTGRLPQPHTYNNHYYPFHHQALAEIDTSTIITIIGGDNDSEFIVIIFHGHHSTIRAHIPLASIHVILLLLH